MFCSHLQSSLLYLSLIHRFPLRYRGKQSLEVPGYETARRQQKERIDRVYQASARSTGRRDDSQADVFRRTKGTEPDYGNCAGWAHARAMPGLCKR